MKYKLVPEHLKPKKPPSTYGEGLLDADRLRLDDFDEWHDQMFAAARKAIDDHLKNKPKMFNFMPK